MKFNRRETLILAAAASALSLSGLTSAQAAEGDMVDEAKLLAPVGNIPDKVQGNPDAPVTVIEYASPTCPHCATFHNTVYEPFTAGSGVKRQKSRQPSQSEIAKVGTAVEKIEDTDLREALRALGLALSGRSEPKGR